MMVAICVISSFLCFGYGYFILAGALSAIHEIEGFLCFLIGAVLFCGAGIMNGIDSLISAVKNK